MAQENTGADDDTDEMMPSDLRNQLLEEADVQTDSVSITKTYEVNLPLGTQEQAQEMADRLYYDEDGEWTGPYDMKGMPVYGLLRDLVGSIARKRFETEYDTLPDNRDVTVEFSGRNTMGRDDEGNTISYRQWKATITV